MPYAIHTADTAPANSRETLVAARKAFGFVPHLLGTMASAAPLLKAYLVVGDLFDQTSLTPTERQIVMLTTSHENARERRVSRHLSLHREDPLSGTRAEGDAVGTRGRLQRPERTGAVRVGVAVDQAGRGLRRLGLRADAAHQPPLQCAARAWGCCTGA